MMDQVGKWAAGILWPSQVLCNRGGAWGIPVESGWFLGLSVGLLGWILWEWCRHEDQSGKGAWILLLAGGIGNGLDRAIVGCVRDFLWLPFGLVVNGADLFLTAGCAWLVADWWKKRRN